MKYIGCLLYTSAVHSAENGYAGLEFLSGIPGTIGGAIQMNAGAYGTEVKDVLISAKAVDEAVSYTHLDVYKRQLYSRRNKKFCDFFKEVSLTTVKQVLSLKD